MWLRDYTKLFNLNLNNGSYGSSEKDTASPGDLAIRFSRALTTFFDSSSTLALNLPQSLSAPISNLASYESHPDPHVFDAVHDHVRDLLKHSLARFVKKSYGNADKNRSLFSILSGVFNIVVNTVVVVLALLMGKPRTIRIIALPIYFLGFLFLFAGMHGRQ